ncbi:hypothetical protein [Burkholderia sp. MSMB1498]|uniref:hypothetical protein n=1 Tax=Burkholderia sp. MSMB1498 TaxID=1637842 RepID=UPI0007572BDE|nr:hypothetical protein [Burkholderia sp. MSMB1498]KVK71722.1 hypothetical protein WS91_22855 [Burkholderia sp. MSMB1498]
MNQFSEPLPADDTDVKIRYRHAVRYLMLQRIAEFQALKHHGYFPCARSLLLIDISSRLGELGGLVGEW